MNRTVGAAATVVTLAITLALTACVPTVDAESTTVATSAAVSSTPEATPTAEPDQSVQTVEPVHTFPSCSDFAGLIPATYTAGTMNGLVPTLLLDSGPRDGANGQAITNADGEPVAYIAAEGDTRGGIGERFCVGPNLEYLDYLNAIRRNGLFSSEGQNPMTMSAGDTINLNPYTITTVGDENGNIYDYSPVPFEIPPQQ